MHKGAVQQLERLRSELASWNKREKGTKIRDEVKLPSAPQVAAFVERVLDRALELARSKLNGKDEGYLLPYWVANEVKDACMLGTEVGHVGLTVRGNVVCSIKDQQFKDTQCRDPTCTNPRCRGNFVEVSYPGELDDGELAKAPTCTLYIAHHKNTSKGCALPPIPIRSAKLNELLATWMKHGRPKVVQMCLQEDSNWRDPETLFISAHLSTRQALQGPHRVVQAAAQQAQGPLPLPEHQQVQEGVRG